MRRSTVRTSILAAMCLLAPGLVATAPSSGASVPSSIRFADPVVQPAAPTVSKVPALSNEKVTLSGDIGTPVVRSVELQRYSTSWSSYATGTTLDDGTYSFTASTTASSRKFRVVAKAEGINPELISATATITTVPQTAALSIIRDGGTILANVTGVLTPAIPGRPVALQYLSGSTWKQIGGKVEEDAEGKIQTTLGLSGLGQWSTRSYRLVASSVNGSYTSTSPTIKFLPGPTELGSKVLRVTTNKNVAVTSKSGVYPGVASLDGGPSGMALETLGLHGNSTSRLAKKPYKLKFAEKTDATKAFAASFGMKNDKTFLLLAHFIDPSGVRDKVGLDLGESLKDTLKWTPKSGYTELFVNDQYMGSYLLTESIKIDKNRVPVDKTRGIVVEVDGRSVSSSKFGFMSPHNFPMTFKDPDEAKTLPDGTVDPEGYTPAKLSALKSRVTKFESALYGSSRANPDTGYAKYLDVPSAIDFYLIKEFTKDNDSDFYRSIFYSWCDYTLVGITDANLTEICPPNSKFVMGPVWDFDRSAGVITDDSTASSSSGWRLRGIGSTHNPNNATHWYVQLFKDSAFNSKVKARWAAKCQVFKTVGQTGAQALADSMGVQASNEWSRWASTPRRYEPKGTTFQSEVNFVKNWYTKRYIWMNGQLKTTASELNGC